MPDLLPDFLSVFLQSVGTWLLTWWMHSTLLIAGVWGTLRLFPHLSSTLQERLWKTALVGAFLTASIQSAGWWRSPLAISLASHPLPRRLHASAPPRLSPTDEIYVRHTFDPADTLPAEPFFAAKRHAAAPSRVEPSSQRISHPVPIPPPAVDWRTWFSWTWLSRLAGLIGLAFLGWGCIRWGRTLATLFAKTDRQEILTAGTAVEVLAELQQESGQRRHVRLILTDGDEEPGAAGWLRPTISLPRRALKELSRAELKSLLAHEFAHLVRRDPPWLAGTFLMQLAFPFQPLLWSARRRWQQVAELECDALAVEWTRDPLALAECLTHVLSWKLPPSPSLVVATLSQGAQISQRVETLLDDEASLDPWRRESWRRMLGPLTCAVLLGVTLLGPQVTGLFPLPHTFAGHEAAGKKTSFATNATPAVDEFVELQKEIQLLKREMEAVNQTAFSISKEAIEPSVDQQQRFAETLARFAKLNATAGKFIQKAEQLPHAIADFPKEKDSPQPPRERTDAPIEDRPTK